MTLAVQTVFIGAPKHTAVFPRKRSSVALARQLTAKALGAWGLETLADSAVLVASELVTNAVEHARGNSLRLTVIRRLSGVRIAVVDLSRQHPTALGQEDGGEHGRGLVIVEALTEMWGTDPLPWGKRVWAHLDAP